MAFRNGNYIKGLTAIVFLLFSGFTKTAPDFTEVGFRDMKGTLLIHHFENESDSLSSTEIVELQDENGLPVWFSRQFHKDVCMTGECKMIRLTLFWDGVGNYLAMEIPEEEPLTKSDHTEFEDADYQKLNTILSDTASILKELKSEELIIVPDSIDPYKAYEIDGYTAATQPALAEVVVKDAVYTCHTLWHTVYGPTQAKILEILDKRVSTNFLRRMFESQDTKKMIWGIRAVEKHSSYHEDFFPLFIQYIRSDKTEISERALQYFHPSGLNDASLQKQLVEVMPDLSTEKKNTIIWKFIESPYVTEEVVFELLSLFQEQQLNIGSLNLIYRLIHPKHLKNQRIMLALERLSKYEDAYVRNLTDRLLTKLKSNGTF